MIKQLIVFMLLGILLCVTAKAQNEKQELPYSFTHKVKGKVDIEELTSDSEKAYLKFMEEKNPHYGINHYLGQYSSFSRNMNNGEHWKDLPNGDRVWRMRLCTKYTKIKGIGIHADTLEIPEGGKLFFYSNDRQHVAGPYNTHNVIGHKQFIVNFPKEDIDVKAFTYPGPKPYSKETAILMMADSAEASARSLKTPTAENIDALIERVINKQIEENQFVNAAITLKEITQLKKLFKKKLVNIHHARVEY